jgi:glycosyltransferase involved in cell wall biosynthesis
MTGKLPKGKPSIVFMNRVYPPVRGASGRVLRDLAQSFAARGWDVSVITSGPTKAKGKDGDVYVHRVKSGLRKRSALGYLIVWLKMMVAALFMARKDIIVTMTDPPMLEVAGRLVCRAKKSRHIHWCQDLYPDLMPALGFQMSEKRLNFLKKISRRSLKQTDKVITIGRCMARKLAHGGVEPGKISVIPNWPDFELKTNVANDHNIKADAPVETDQAQNTGATTKPRKFRVLYSGNLGRAHPVETILQAAKILNQDCPDIEIVFVGDGPNFERFATLRAKAGLENIRFLPYQPVSKIRDVMESGDVHLITMKNETAGMLVPCKLYAALAVERPCILIGPEQSEVGQVITEFKAGAVIAQGDYEELAATIRTYRDDAQTWFSAHEGAKKAGQVFLPSQSIDAWISRAEAIASLPEIPARKVFK